MSSPCAPPVPVPSGSEANKTRYWPKWLGVPRYQHSFDRVFPESAPRYDVIWDKFADLWPGEANFCDFLVEMKQFLDGKEGKERAEAIELLEDISSRSYRWATEMKSCDLIGDAIIGEGVEAKKAGKKDVESSYHNFLTLVDRNDQVDEEDEGRFQFPFDDSLMNKSLSDPAWFFFSSASGIIFLLHKGHY
jgi:hypothetical protein